MNIKKRLPIYCQIAFQKGAQMCTPSFQQCMRLPSSLQSCQRRIVSLKNKAKQINLLIL